MTGPTDDEGRVLEGDAADRKLTGRPCQVPRVDHATARGHLGPLIAAGMELIPLKRRSKEPVGKWRDGPAMTADAATRLSAGGGNLGVRLRATDLVIDVDRHGDVDGTSALTRLHERFGLPDTLTVATGGGGLHIYLRVDGERKLRGKLAEYPGIDFKTHGGYVVAPGSVHPDTGKTYAVDPLADTSVAEAPAELVAALTKESANETSAGGEISPERLAELLEALDPVDFAGDKPWLDLAMACHHGTGGDGEDVFIVWSLGDATYSPHEEVSRRRWRSMRADGRGDRITVATLYAAVYASGKAHLVPADHGAAIEDFDGEEVEIPDGALDARPPETVPLSSAAPMAVAEAMLRKKAVVRSNGDWLRYDATRNSYVEEEEAFKARVWKWTDGRSYRKGEEDKTLVASSALVANVTAAASAQRQGPRDLPAWHPPVGVDPDPADLLAVRNGLLNLVTGELLTPSPRFINRNASPVTYDPAAARPQRWERFLAEVFPDDREVVETLQEVVGYLLTQDTSQQKIFAIVGPPRSGKGTINRVVQLLLGPGNYTSPSAVSLSRGEFGLQGLIGRSLATVSDMRMGRNADPATLVENMLRISGEDEVSVNRKFKEAWEGRLSTRFLILSNELPQFRDTSGAIMSRLILMRGHVSFLGREDPALTHDLRAELPGILIWALRGLERLRARGHFVQPRSSEGELEAMTGLASPVKAFARERLRQSGDSVTAKAEIWRSFSDWAADAGLPYTGTMGHFFKDLNTVGLTFKKCRPRTGDGRAQSVVGLELLPND